MLYRVNPKNGDKISQLGFGCMRFPRNGAQTDVEKSTQLIKRAIEKGVNYFDTAYIYPGSEETLGTALKTLGKRDSVKIASKMPIIMCKTNADFDRIFNKQLERLQTDRIDYYLMHMLCDIGTWERLKSIGVIEWLETKKQEGKIINAGFSYHGGKNEFKEIVDAYDWGFCMVQYNYMDENNQAGKTGVQYASQRGLPVFVMEPLRGGMLVNGLPKDAKEIFAKANEGRSLVEWSLRWLWNQPEVTMLLSGMNQFKQLKENITIASTAGIDNLTHEDFNVYKEVLSSINRTIKVPCTGCAYCMPCPKGVDIPTCFSCYNESYSSGFFEGMKNYFMTTGTLGAKQSNASKCVKCGLCESHCPQKIEIRNRLTDVSKRMESFWFAPVSTIARKVMKIK